MNQARRRRAILAAGGLALVGVVGYGVYEGIRTATVRVEVARQIAESTARANEAAARRAEEFEAFVHERKSAGLADFSKDVTSYTSSWLALKGKLPFTDADEHRKFVEESFGKRLFTPASVSERIAKIANAFEQDLLEEQNKLAVSIRREVGGGSHPPAGEGTAREAMASTITAAASSAQSGAAVQIGSLVVSETVSKIASQVLRRLGVTAGILSAGAATSWWTLGAGAAIGLAVDAALRYFKDPQEDVGNDISRSLDEFAVRGRDSIRQELERVVNERSKFWREAAKDML